MKTVADLMNELALLDPTLPIFIEDPDYGLVGGPMRTTANVPAVAEYERGDRAKHYDRDLQKLKLDRAAIVTIVGQAL